MDTKFYADCIRKGDDPEAVLRVALNEQFRGGARMIAAERERQVTEEGWTAEHDAGHERDLARAAQAYIGNALRTLDGSGWTLGDSTPVMWPWEDRYWKPTGDPVRDLVKAGALIAAAIDALERDRATASSEGGANA